MTAATLVATRSITLDCTKAFDHTLDAVASKVGLSNDQVTTRLRARDRDVWSRFRYELSRELAAFFTEHFPQIHSVHLWEQEEEEGGAADAPADPSLDLILRMVGNPGSAETSLQVLAGGVAQELSAVFSRRVPDTPFVLTVHRVGDRDAASGHGMATVFRAIHQPPLLVWASVS